MTAANYKDQALWKEFVCGVLAAMAGGMVTHPIDLVKVRMQLRGSACDAHLSNGVQVRVRRPNILSTGYTVFRNEGALALYSGLTATLTRQCTYAGTKFGMYNLLKVKLSGSDGSISFLGKCFCALAAGGLGAIVGNPADMCMVRMQADGRLPAAERRGYKNAFDAIRRVTAEEGIYTLWRGCSPTVQRGMIITAAQLAVYDDSKAKIIQLGYQDGFIVHFLASMVAAVVASLVSNPIDVAKTRLQSMKLGADGKFPYRNLPDCFVKTVKMEGPIGLYKGLGPTFARQVPINCTVFIVIEQLRKLFYR